MRIEIPMSKKSSYKDRNLGLSDIKECDAVSFVCRAGLKEVTVSGEECGLA